jgi:2-polyprenyl-6-methoxyphenol hydroxylase-like FAD-dependent oxidoreductase
LYKQDNGSFQTFVLQLIEMNVTSLNTETTSHHLLYDVIISGAGPVGLFLACELALAKCSVLILEKAADSHSTLKQLPFGIRGLSAPTIAALDRRDLLQDLEIYKHLKNPHQNAGQGARRQVGHFAGIPFHEGDIDSAQWKYHLSGPLGNSLISEMQELERLLTRRANALGVDIRRGHPVTDFHQTADEVTVEVGDKIYKSKWLVGCDGSRSIVRKKGSFEFAGTEPEFTGYTTRMELADAGKLKPGRNLTAAGMYLQSQPGYVVIQDFDGGAFHHTDQPITLEHVQEVLRRISDTDVTITALHTATTWTDRARQATAYRKGRVLLAGDAAHIHAPLGGQGLNLGLGDAMNLGWKLAATILEKAPAGLLDSYHAEQYPIGVDVLNWSRAQVAIMKPEPPSRALNAIFRDLLNTRDGATYFAARVWGIQTHYDLGGTHPLIGYSVPNFEWEDGMTIGKHMHEGKAVLIDFETNGALQALANGYDQQIKYVSGRAKEQLGLSALLVRPDGMVAWATDGNPDLDGLGKAVARWFYSPGLS